MSNIPEKPTLPTIAEIVSGEVSVSQKQNELNVLLNQPPPPAWIEVNKYAGNSKYLPIDKVEYLLTSIFISWSVEIKQVQVVANSITVVVRLNYKNPVTGEIDWQDGLGATPIHTESGAGAMDWNAVLTDSVHKCAPAAESYAIKDAAEKIGRVFGKDLNRKDTVAYDGLINADPERFKDAKLIERG